MTKSTLIKTKKLILSTNNRSRKEQNQTIVLTYC